MMMTTSLAASETTINAAVAVLAQPDGSFGIKRRTKSTAKAFLGGKNAFSCLPTGFGQSSVKHSDVLWLGVGPLTSV